MLGVLIDGGRAKTGEEEVELGIEVVESTA